MTAPLLFTEFEKRDEGRSKLRSVDRIPLTSPLLTLVHLAHRLDRPRPETAINEADKLGLIDPEELRSDLDRIPRQPGLALLRAILAGDDFVLTDSELERLFLPIARRAGLGLPRTRQRLNGFLVDFFWPDLGLVVETDGLTYHRTPAEQARDRLRDQRHTAAGLTCLRFTHYQVTHEPTHVIATLKTVTEGLRRRFAERFGSP
jgi:very-short-patch-repair endonuclease